MNTAELCAWRITELERQLVEYRTKHDVACSTLEIVKEQRTAAQKALAEQCQETKRLERQTEWLRKALQEATASKVQMPSGYSIKHVEGHGWIIDPPHGSRWIAFEGTPAGDFMAALTTAPLQSSRIGSDKGPCNCGADRTDAVGAGGQDIKEMVNRFLGWELPKDFAPDCGISFDGRKDDEWNKGKTWPIGTNLLTADQAKTMFEYCLRSTTNSAAHQEGVNLATQGGE